MAQPLKTFHENREYFTMRVRNEYFCQVAVPVPISEKTGRYVECLMVLI